jgi:hypothetical protein
MCFENGDSQNRKILRNQRKNRRITRNFLRTGQAAGFKDRGVLRECAGATPGKLLRHGQAG